MKIGRLLSPVHSLGPGERVCLWTQGCSKKCIGCISPELQAFAGNETDEALLGRIIIEVAKKGRCSGLTVSGGDPFEQAPSLLVFLRSVREFFDDILVYTGFELREILDGAAGKEGTECLEYIDVLIDGRYERWLNKPDCVLRGSTNQRIHYLNKEKEAIYTEYMKKGRILESFVHDNKTIITGILNEEEEQ